MSELTFSVSVPVKYSCDLCVVGAGPSGVAAAVTAARRGLKVTILDAHTMAGGMSTAARVPLFMIFNDGKRSLMPGFGEEVRSKLDTEEPINSEKLKFIYEELLTDAGVRVIYSARLAHVIHSEGRISAAVFASLSGMFAVEAPLFVDATGDGTLAAWSGADFKVGDDVTGEVMPSTLCSLWTGFDWAEFIRGGARSHNDDKLIPLLEAAYAAGELSEMDYHHTGMTKINAKTAGGNIGHVFDINAMDEISVTDGLIQARRSLREYERFYQRHISGFADASIVDSGSMLGIRESRRITGEYVLCREDYVNRASFPDEIGRYNYPADIHPSRSTKEELQAHKNVFRGHAYQPGESYGIPYRILVPLKVDNLLLAGRCVSCDRYMFSSLRTIPGAYITGQAAGVAAAIAHQKQCLPRQLDGVKVNSELRASGMLPAE
jgi:hypothetical protein